MDYLSSVRVLDTDYKIKDEEAARINHTHKIEEIDGAAKEGHKHQASEIDGLSTVATSGSYSDLHGKPSAATDSADGLMSSADKKKLDGVDDGANNYVHPASAAGAKSSGLYKVATDAQGHVTGATAVTKADITALGIPGSDTKYTHPAGNAASKTEGLYKFSTDSTSHVASATPVSKADISPLESDPTVPAWAKAASKPSYNSSEIAYSEGVAGETVTDRLGGLTNQIRVHDDQFKDLNLLINTKAPINSPSFNGTPKAPTAAAGTNTTQIATTAFVQSAVAAASTGAAKYQGGMTPASYTALTAYKQGWYWVVTEAGAIAGESCEVGDMVFCNTDNTASSTKSNAHFDVVQNNIDAIPLSVINALS